MAFIKELVQFLMIRKKLWLAPIIIILLLLAILMLVSQNAMLAPFIYTLF